MNKKLVIGICAALVAGIGAVGVLLLGADKNNQRDKEYKSLIPEDVEKYFEKGRAITLNKDQLDVIFSVIKDPKSTENKRTGGYYVLSMAEAENDAFSPPLETAIFATSEKNLTDKTRGELFRTVTLNPKRDIKAHETLLSYAAENPNKEITKDIIRRMKNFAEERHLEEILSVFENATELTTQTTCSDTINEIVRRSGSKNRIAANLINRYNVASDKPLKLAYLRILGITGTEEALATLVGALKSNDNQLILAAAKGLSKYPTSQPFNDMLTVFASEKAEDTNNRIRNAIFELLINAKDLNNTTRAQYWYEFIKKAPSIYSRKQIVARVATIKKSVWTAEVLAQVANNSDFDIETTTYAKNKLQEHSK